MIVCTKAYDNVPQRRFFKPEPTHAVGYADGTTDRISVEEFNRLDLSEFVSLSTIAPENVRRY